MFYNKKEKTITTERLVLRLFQKSDVEEVTRLCNNYNIYKSTLYLPYPYKINDALTWIETHQDNFDKDKLYELAITDKKNGTLIGAIALSNNQHFDQGEVAYWIGEEFWGHGYATEAAQAMIKFAFEDKKYHKVFARCFRSNPASGRVLQKLGMKQEGILLDQVKKENKYKDLVCYGIINQ